MVHMGWLTFCLTNYYMKKKSIDKSKLVLYHKFTILRGGEIEALRLFLQACRARAT